MQCLLRRARIAPLPIPSVRAFNTTPLLLKTAMPTRPKPPPDSEIEESYLKGSGPGGQKINKTNSAVQLKHLPTGIVVKSQATRSRSQNRKHAREILAQRLDDLANGDNSRANIVGQVRKKRADSAAKKSRRKYKKLEEEKDAAAAAAAAEDAAEDAESQRTDEVGSRTSVAEEPQIGTQDTETQVTSDASVNSEHDSSKAKRQP